jgi:hypothetical protein
VRAGHAIDEDLSVNQDAERPVNQAIEFATFASESLQLGAIETINA